MAQLKELVKRGIKRQYGAARMHASEELCVAPEVVHPHVLTFGLTEQFVMGAVKKKQPDGDGPVMEAETANALGPLLLQSRVECIRQRIVNQSHLLPAVMQ